VITLSENATMQFQRFCALPETKFMHDSSIVAIYSPGLCFCRWHYWSVFIHFYTASVRKAVQGNVVRYSRPRSFNVIEIGTHAKPICDFLLVFYNNYMPILCRFQDITIY